MCCVFKTNYDDGSDDDADDDEHLFKAKKTEMKRANNNKNRLKTIYTSR